MSSPFITKERASQWLAKNRDSVKLLIDLKSVAKAEHDRVEAYTKPLLAKYNFRAASLGLPVTTVSNLYLVENDEERLSAFFEELSDLHAANGWKGERGHCPALTARNAAVDCELKFLPAVAVLLGVPVASLRNSIEPSKKAIELVMKLYEAVL